MLSFTHAHLVAFCVAVLVIAGVNAMLWSLEVMTGIRKLRTHKLKK